MKQLLTLIFIFTLISVIFIKCKKNESGNKSYSNLTGTYQGSLIWSKGLLQGTDNNAKVTISSGINGSINVNISTSASVPKSYDIPLMLKIENSGSRVRSYGYEYNNSTFTKGIGATINIYNDGNPSDLEINYEDIDINPIVQYNFSGSIK
ncbi:MAG: hypothetical protein IPI46_12385 [Bacteroidetes bacterium]|nr:hypothetical protein [Bacteroidota bacterium]